MKNFKVFSIAVVFSFAFCAMQACSFSTANLSSLETYKDEGGKEKTGSFKAGDTIYGKATVSNNPGKVKVKFSLADPQGKAIPGADVSVEVSSGTNGASYSVPIPAAAPAGTYKLTADMINEAGEKKDSKSAAITIAQGG